MAGRFYGIEFIDDTVGGITVSESRAATLLLVGTAPVGDVHADPADRAAHINQPVLIRNLEDAIAAYGPRVADFTLPTALAQVIAEAGPKGIGRIYAVNVFDPDTHATHADVTAADIIGGFTADGRATGLQVGLTLFNRFGSFAKIVDVPGFSAGVGVRAALTTLCVKTGARTLLNAPAATSLQAAIEARGPDGAFNFQFDSTRITPLWPRMRMSDPANAEQTVLVPYSSTFAGVWMRTIQELGWHHSPSNQPIYGIEEAELDVIYIPGQADSDPFVMRDAGYATVESRFGKGLHTSGNRSSAHPASTDLRSFMHAQLTEDVLTEALTLYLEEFKDKPGSPARIEAIEEGANAYLKSKMAGNDPAISDGTFRFDRTFTTNASVAQGRFAFDLDYAPIGIMEHIQVRREIDINLLGNPLGLSAA
ncbi:hypothetical protein AN189_13095 [Loktanella sp. 3ANDIMAR09]|uniref:hypothetical protein n=1 Tax=Loktanella sp. 3ANDIMAR09 TaxID=1225657 RepID=UPI0006F7F7BB|nr:hypothetical protein [Loktanella sp. 3ANDIMAR09]KQI67999.1 hypothetical protein AN189_13095 [Loktanella sp. 3ANDIMAR09]